MASPKEIQNASLSYWISSALRRTWVLFLVLWTILVWKNKEYMIRNGNNSSCKPWIHSKSLGKIWVCVGKGGAWQKCLPMGSPLQFHQVWSACLIGTRAFQLAGHKRASTDSILEGPRDWQGRQAISWESQWWSYGTIEGKAEVHWAGPGSWNMACETTPSAWPPAEDSCGLYTKKMPDGSGSVTN